MSDLFREVAEEVRQEQIIQFVKRYGVHLVVVVVAAILLLAGYNYWEDQKNAERAALSERFEAALSTLSSGKAIDAAGEFEALAADAGPSGYGLLAGFRRADALAQAADITGAVGAYDAVAESAGADRFFRDLARIFAASLLVDTASSDEIEERLAPVRGEGNSLRYLAMELLATSHYRAGRMREGETLFGQIGQEAGVSSGVRLRALQMLAIIGTESPASESLEENIGAGAAESVGQSGSGDAE